MRAPMPATDSSSPAAPLTSIGRSIRSLRRDQIPTIPPPSAADPNHHASSDLDPTDAFQRRAADLFTDLLAENPNDLLSLSWMRRLLDSFLLCLEEFRALLFGSGAAAAAARPPLDRLVTDFFDRAVKALDLCNAVRDGLDLVRQWRKHLAIAAAVLATSPDPDAPLGEAQIRRARKALTDLTILMLDDRDGGGGVVGQRNRSFGLGNRDARARGQGHHRRSSSGGSSGSGSGSHLRSLSWSVSRAWSAARQLQAIGGGLPVPRPHDITATGGLASAVYTMGAVLFIVAWALVAAIPCQDRGLQAHFSVPRNFPWSGPISTLYDRILEEFKKERKNSCGLLKEIDQIERCSRHLMEITDAAEFPLAEEKDAEVREAAQELVQVCGSLKDGLDPLERQIREMFHRIVRTRTEILDCLSGTQ
ncbi:protein BYPASS1-LIKE-like [Phragmites australis]|uniref:protein BYPASS1-LIKE-like n=1 Tax=Phragmites australis TaxID=29695 RepID=UPI002D7907CB|nr:protein BYPASS1-LIKE-like [Phragmites australis]